MRKFLKCVLAGALSAAFVVFFSANMFYCFVAGAPVDGDAAARYIIFAACFSILMPSAICLGGHYISYLHRQLTQREP